MNNISEPTKDHKIFALAPEKRERILNAAMKEFANGYKNASTDSIVRESGISKGLLFHYFRTKKDLFLFLHDYTLQMVLSEFFNLINLNERDILERWRQIILLKIDLVHKYPAIFAFVNAVYMKENKEATFEISRRKSVFYDDVYGRLFSDIDTSLFREEINPKKAVDVIIFTMEGYAAREASPDKTIEDYEPEYERILNEVEEYIGLLRRCLYK